MGLFFKKKLRKYENDVVLVLDGPKSYRFMLLKKKGCCCNSRALLIKEEEEERKKGIRGCTCYERRILRFVELHQMPASSVFFCALRKGRFLATGEASATCIALPHALRVLFTTMIVLYVHLFPLLPL